MTLGGRRVAVRRPRMRTAGDERELPTRTDERFADRDPLTRAVSDRMMAASQCAGSRGSRIAMEADSRCVDRVWFRALIASRLENLGSATWSRQLAS